MYNSITIVGNLGKDPEMRYLPNGTAVCNFNMAVTKNWTSNGEKQSKTLWFKITVWGKAAELHNQYLSKGSRVLVEGELDVDIWTSKNGTAGATLVVTARTVTYLSTKSDGQSAPSNPASTHVEEDDDDIGF